LLVILIKDLIEYKKLISFSYSITNKTHYLLITNLLLNLNTRFLLCRRALSGIFPKFIGTQALIILQGRNDWGFQLYI